MDKTGDTEVEISSNRWSRWDIRTNTSEVTRYSDRRARTAWRQAEVETIIRWDQEERVAHLWTAYESGARRWERQGYSVRVYSRFVDGTPRSWSAKVSVDAIRWRRVAGGQILRRRGHRKGQVFRDRTDELVGSDEQRRGAKRNRLGRSNSRLKSMNSSSLMSRGTLKP